MKIQLRRGTAQAWTARNPTLAQGELGIETDTGLFKIGDGSLAWMDLLHANHGSVAQVGDIEGMTLQLVGGIPQYRWGTPQIVVKSADQAFSSTTLTDVADLAFAVLAGATYHIRFILQWQSANVIAGMKVTIVHPGATRFSCVAQTPVAADGVAAMLAGLITSSGDAVSATAVPAANTDQILMLDGLIESSVSGTLKVQAAATSGVVTATVRRSSIGLLTRVA